MQENIRLIPIGGLGEIGRNMMVIEYTDVNNETSRLVVDAGIGFLSGAESEGIRYSIPNVAYLQRHNRSIRALLITHGHYDHFAAVGHVMEDIGYPPIFAPPMARELIISQHREFQDASYGRHGGPSYEDLYRPEAIDPHARGEIALPPFKVRWFRVTHSIPDAVGYVIETPMGNIVHTGDFRFDKTPIIGEPVDDDHLRAIGNNGVLALLSDSTGALKEGTTLSEAEVYKCLDERFGAASGRIILTSFASQIERLQQIVTLAHKHGRRVALVGMTWRKNSQIAQRLGHLVVPEGVLIDARDIEWYDPEDLVLVCTGSQGEENAMLSRIARGDSRDIHLGPTDTVIYSSSVIPGNERTVEPVKRQIRSSGAELRDIETDPCIHASGHANADDLADMITMLRPKFVMPVHGEPEMLAAHTDIARRNGAKDAVVAHDGAVVELTQSHIALTNSDVEAGMKLIMEDPKEQRRSKQQRRR